MLVLSRVHLNTVQPVGLEWALWPSGAAGHRQARKEMANTWSCSLAVILLSFTAAVILGDIRFYAKCLHSFVKKKVFFIMATKPVYSRWDRTIPEPY